MRAGRVVVGRVRRAAAADGAGESGLSALLGTHALSSAGDALVTVALAGTVFFSVPLGQARGRVALYLVLTLLPFSLLVPVAGPVLDRFRHGRRNVLALTAAARGLVAWSMATETASLALYPLALAVLVLSRAYGVARSAATPRVRPPGVSLVAANARMNVAAVGSASIAAGLGAGLGKLVGVGWVLRLAALVLLAAAVFAIRLPAQIDEERAPRVRGVPRYRLLAAPPSVQRPLVAAVALRALAGLLTIFLAFLLKGDGAGPLVVGTVLGAAVAGQLVGTGLASRLPERVTARLTLASLVVPALGCLFTAVLGGPVLAAVAAGLSGVSYALSKFALDASLQTHVPLASTSGAFARSETALQLSWAVGGGVAVALPTVFAVGFGVAAAVPVLGIVMSARASAGHPVFPTRARPPAGAGQPGSTRSAAAPHDGAVDEPRPYERPRDDESRPYDEPQPYDRAHRDGEPRPRDQRTANTEPPPRARYTDTAPPVRDDERSRPVDLGRPDPPPQRDPDADRPWWLDE